MILFMSYIAADGDYWRLLNPGEYNIIVWAEGYFPVKRQCNVGSEAQATICDFNLTKTPQERIKQILAKGGKILRDEQLRIRALRMRKLRVSTKILNRRREQQLRRAKTRTKWYIQGQSQDNRTNQELHKGPKRTYLPDLLLTFSGFSWTTLNV